MKKHWHSLGMGLLLLTGTSVWAGNLSVTGTTDKPDAMYQPGEKMEFRIQLLEDGKPVAGKKLSWVRTGDDQKTAKGVLVSKTEPVIVTTSTDKPGFVRLIVTALDDNGKPCKNEKKQDVAFNGGAGVEPGKLQGTPEPKDFDAFWDGQKKELAKVPLKFTLSPAAVKNPKLEGFDVRVDCAGGKPVSGYLARPKGAAPKSLPALVSFHGYGVSGADMPETSAFRGMLAFDINAHGIDNGKDKAYYDNLKNGELKGYGFSGNDKAETCYFRGMLLRVMRALEFVKAQPEWDGKNLIVLGGSQGGFQALAAAGLDPQVTFCVAGKPWLCDLGGVKQGRLGGWRPGYTEFLNYIDPANHAKRIKCPVSTDIGLGDYVCPPSGVSVMVNNIKGTKTMVYVQGATHGYAPPKSTSCWQEYGRHLNKILKK